MRFKRIIAALTAVMLIIPQGISVMAADADPEKMTEIFSEDFEGYEVGEAPGNGWNVIATDGCTVEAGEIEGHGKVMVLDDKVKEGIHCKLMRNLPAQRGIVTWQFDYMDSNENSVARMFANGSGVSVTALQVQPWAIDGTRGFHNFVYQYKDKKGETCERGIMRINAATWYRMTYIIDTRRAVWSLYVNGVQMVAEEPFLYKTAVVDELGIYSSSWQVATSYVDNFRVYSGTPDPEKLGIRVKKRSEGINYGDKLIAEPGNREIGEDILDWTPWFILGGDAETAEDSGETVFKLSNTKIKKTFEPQRKMVKMSLDYKESSTEGQSEFLIRNDIAPIVQLVLKKRDGKSYFSNMNANGTRTECAESEIGQWHHLELNLDVEKCRYDVFLDGNKVISGMETREFTSAVNMCAIYCDGTADKYSLSVKNLVVTEKDVPEVKGEKRHPDTFENNVPKLEGRPTYDNFKGVMYPFTKYKQADGTYDLKAIEQDIELMRDAGTHWVRTGINVYSNLEDMDKIINMFYDNGINIVMSIEKVNPSNEIGTPEQEAENAEGYKMLAERYKDRIRDWEVGNEPNLGGFWNQASVETGGSGDRIKDYVIHLKNVYTALKEVDPELNVIIGGVSEWVAEWFFDEFGKFEGYKYVDELCFHPYADTPEGVVERIKSVKKHIAQWPEPYNHFPMWITEVGFHTMQVWTVPSTVPDEVIKANYVQGTYEKIWEEMGEDVRPICWYSYMEESSAPGYGLVAVDYANGFRNCTKLLALDAYAAVDDVTPREKKPTVIPKPDNADKPDSEKAEAQEKLEEIHISINGEESAQKGYIRNNVVFVPMRAVLETAGAEVSWNEAESAAEVRMKNGNSMICRPGKAEAVLNGVYVKTDAAAEISDGCTMIPIRLAEKTVGEEFDYSEASKTVNIVVK
ncbi:MAG: stalk domain-containing protein [Candidatus Ornithomonoglobus sp.]